MFEICICYQAKQKPLITQKQKQKRLEWAKKHQIWVRRQWDTVIWSDESRFEVCVGDTRGRVIRTKHEALHKDCLRRAVKFPASLMVFN